MTRHLLQFLLLQYLIVKMKLQLKGMFNFNNKILNIIIFFFSRAQLNIKSNRNNRKNVISCVTVGESDNEEQLPSKSLTYHQKQLQSLRSTPVIYQSPPKSSNIQVQLLFNF